MSHPKGSEPGTHLIYPQINISQSVESNNTAVTNIYYYGGAVGTTNAMPTLGWTSQDTGGTFPTAIVKNQLPTGSTILKSQWIKGYQTVNGYFVFQAQVNSTPSYISTYTCPPSGTPVKSLTGTAPSLTTQAAVKAWTQKNIDAFNNQLAGVNNPINAPVNNPNDSKVYNTVAPTAANRYNPPPHITSRGTSFGERINSTNALVALDAKGHKVTQTYIQQLQLQDTRSNRHERGRIIQDQYGANALNKNLDGIKGIPAPVNGAASLWGFRFMYNPQTFQYTTASNNSVDWTMGSKDPATLLAGNQTVQFELYLNRIADLSYLKDLKHDPANVMPITQAYVHPGGGTGLSSDAIDGILNRGTEYDIEFLYRVLNGDPMKKPLLFGSYNGVTSDFGYTTGTPCWLYLHDNMRYFGSITNLSVNHMMFDLNMVPMFTIVSVTFARYPALWTDAAAGVTQSGLYTNIAKVLAGTTATPATKKTGT